MDSRKCPILKNKRNIPRQIIDLTIEGIDQNRIKKINLIWLEACGCSGNIISLLNAEDPDVIFLLNQMVNLTYNNSLMAQEGERAFDRFLKTLETEFILVVEGAVSTKDNGLYNVIARHEGKLITGMEAVTIAGRKAKYVLAVGSCASYGGPSSARPNPSSSKSVYEYLDREVIRIPGCPSHPQWAIGTIAHIISFGKPKLDEENRPVIFYGVTIHDTCTRRSYFDKGIFAERLGEKECMFKLGCRGPITRTDCPIRRWNDSTNWPIGDNTPCIGCARSGFPDSMEPFIRY
ncbi:hydrogenase small subunit [Maledivibacter halophilus]|uniref:Hydrogenase small subunit n=1 Tax=Maledivibacter halophilus TaxID=36842 RepID=A0A1T5L963_9FIRM|nr:hydrogenase small subunit [Maledivibacter halophilus]SKC72567.1 hydrogenase small subunit [Maledivibacter halophilus]